MSPYFQSIVEGTATGAPRPFEFPEYIILVPIAWIIFKAFCLASHFPLVNNFLKKTGFDKLRNNKVQALILISLPIMIYITYEIEINYKTKMTTEFIVDYFYLVVFILAAGRGIKSKDKSNESSR